MNPPATPASSSSGGNQQSSIYTPVVGTPEYHQAAAAAVTANAVLSQQQHQQLQQAVSPAPTNGKKRRAAGVPGSRGVANLTPEQLAKKRSNDREAQRAIRERTKNTIDTLERRIKELEGQQPFQELQRVIQERDRALAECEDLRRRLGAVAGIVGGQPPGLNELANLTAQQSPLPAVSSETSGAQTQQSQQSQLYTQTVPTPSGHDQHHLHPDLRSPRQSDQRASPVQQLQRYDQTRSPLQAMSSQGHTSGERVGLNFLLESTQQRGQPSRTGRDSSTLLPILYNPSAESSHLPIYARLPKTGPASCLLDDLLNNFRDDRRKMLDTGIPVADALGPKTPAYFPFMYPQHTLSLRMSPHPLSKLLIDVLSKFPDIAQLPEKVAVLYVMFLVLRWSICPCQSCYDALPEFSRPTTEQLEKQHPTWVDHLPWPFMRNQLIRAEKEIDFNDFFVPYTTTLSLNWPYSSEMILVQQPQQTANSNTTPSRTNRADEPNSEFVINPAFEQHCRTLSNWSLGSAFPQAFPHLVDESVRIEGQWKTEREDRSV